MAKLNVSEWDTAVAAIPASGDNTTYSAVIDARKYGLFGVKLPATFTGTKLAIQACESESGTFAAAYDYEGNAIGAAVTGLGGKWVQLNFEAFPFPFIKLFFTDDDGVAQANAGKSFTLVMKS